MPYRKLSVKLIFWVVAITVIVIGIFNYVNLNTQRRHLLDEAVLGAKQLSGTLMRSLRFDMLHNYREALYNSIETIGTQEEIEKIRIFNKEGAIMFSSDKEETGQMVDKHAEACYACHAEKEPLERLDIPERSRIFQTDKYRILGMITPIYNESDCYTAACHVHPRDQKVLGVLDIAFSLDATDKRIRDIRGTTMLLMGITILTVSAIIVLFIQKAVYRPVRELAEGTTRVAAGDFTHAIPSRSEDEIGQLAKSFNTMTQRLKEIQYQLLQSEKLASIGKLSATIAHEINNPLNGILTYTKLIERKLVNGSLKKEEIPKFRSYLAIMERETERCSTIVRNLLDFARQREPSLKPDIDVNEVVEEALSLLANQIALQEITVHKQYGKIPPIMADATQLRQVFLNIILNSCEAMNNGGTLTITTAFSDKRKKAVRVEIADNGWGIDEKDLSKIFDPFFTSKEQGTGLGLSVVYGIISSHHGTIQVKSKVGEGTTIVIKLPVEVVLNEAGHPPGEGMKNQETSKKTDLIHRDVGDNAMREKIQILVVDDEEIVRESLLDWLREDGYQVEAAEDGFKALEKFKERPWDIALVDLKMPKMDGLELMKKIKETHPETQVVIITAFATVNTAVQAMKIGAYDYLVKPFNPEELSLLIKRLVESQNLVKEISYLRKELQKQYQFHDLISKSGAMQKVFDLAHTIAKSNANILILGESGTGKELLARAIHNESLRAAGPFIPVSCVALTETLLESELFGHEKGAFTDAIAQKKGKFELADGGTIFLDEIGDISPKLQLSLLRVLQEKEFTRVGGTKPITVDVRIIAATNRDLKKAVDEGKFRDDLYYRLNVIAIELPPLREHQEDIPLLAHHFIEKFNIEMGGKIERISEEALELLIQYDWPGNVRELENVIERAMVITKGTFVKAEDLHLSPQVIKDKGAASASDDKTIKAVEKKHIAKILKENNWNIQKSAEKLGIDRVTLYNKIKKYKLAKE